MDYETLSNLFLGVFEHYTEPKRKIFLIWKYKDETKDFIDFLESNQQNKEWHISYNGLAFDSQITHWVLENKQMLLSINDGELVARMIYAKAQEVITCKDRGEYLPYSERSMKIKQIDIFKMNHWDNPAKMSSLKWIQYSMDWYNIEEMPIHHTTEITSNAQVKTIIDYCINDVRSTKQIMTLSREQIMLRKQLTNEYKINLYSASEPRISKELFGLFLSKKLQIKIFELKKLRTPRPHIALAECILPYVKFNTMEMQSVLNFIKSKVITQTKGGLDYKIHYKGVDTYYGLGGIHGAARSGVYEAKAGWTIMTSDVTSFYPNLAIRNGFHPEHLPKDAFLELYEWFFDERKIIPKKDPKNYVYKIILNSTYGLSNDENSFLYDPKFTMQITINGQLLLSMLYEMLAEGIPGAVPLMQNTDGLEMMIPEGYKDKYLEICAEWEKICNLQLEHDEYSKLVLADVNNYIAIYKDGKPPKAKGRFEWEPQDQKTVAALHKNKSFLVVPKAVYNYFVHGIMPEQSLVENRNIYDYCGGLKAKGAWRFRSIEVVQKEMDKYRKYTKEQRIAYLKSNGWHESWASENWVHSSWLSQEANNGLDTDIAFFSSIPRDSVIQYTELNKIVRYYISKKGKKLIKYNSKDGREMQVNAGSWLATTINNTDGMMVDMNTIDIDKEYYLQAIYKDIINIDSSVSRSAKQLNIF
jgi:hypothetical protein